MIEGASERKFRFIPFRKRDIVEMCLQDKLLDGREEDFRQLYRMLDSIFHYEFHKTVENLKDAYATIDPDADTRHHERATCPDRVQFVELLRELLEKANYERVTEAELNQALQQSSLFKIRLFVDFGDFSEVLLFCRGESTRREMVPGWMGLFSRNIEFINYDRVMVYLRFRDDAIPSDDRLPACRPGATVLKLFRNVPRADLEMLFPNTHVRMRLVDKLLIGIPAAVSGGIVLTTKLGTALVLLGSLLGFWMGLSSHPVELNKTTLMALLAGLMALGGYLWKQINGFKNRKLRFMQALTQNLYFKNLDNNAGVFHRIANDAEEEECKESLLAYYFLLTSQGPLSRSELDRKAEAWMATKWQCAIDFEIDDALEKLIALKLVHAAGGKFTALPLSEGIRVLDQQWDNYFTAAGGTE